MKPVVDELIKKYAGTYDIRIMNGSSGDPEVEALANKFGIQYVPTFVFVNTDGTVSGQVVGAVPASKLEAELAKLK
jgi:thioredoxin-like negative regulator of GroEL